MEDETLSFGFSTSSRSSWSRLKSHLELFIEFDEGKGDGELLRTDYPCPFCADDFDLLELCCHIDLDHHPIETKSGNCPVCAVWVGTNMVEHITAQHGNIIKLKSKCYKHESYPISFSRKDDLLDGEWQSRLSPATSTFKAACDPFLSFLYSGATFAAERENILPDSSSEVNMEEINSDDALSERDVQPSISDKDQIEKARRSGFVQELLLSTILASDL